MKKSYYLIFIVITNILVLAGCSPSTQISDANTEEIINETSDENIHDDLGSLIEKYGWDDVYDELKEWCGLTDIEFIEKAIEDQGKTDYYNQLIDMCNVLEINPNSLFSNYFVDTEKSVMHKTDSECIKNVDGKNISFLTNEFEVWVSNRQCEKCFGH